VRARYVLRTEWVDPDDFENIMAVARRFHPENQGGAKNSDYDRGWAWGIADISDRSPVPALGVHYATLCGNARITASVRLETSNLL
jgi:hypothetical protein